VKCGEAVFVKDFYGAIVLRCIAQCEGRFMLVSHTFDQRNGYLLSGWRGVLRELVALTVPAKLIEKTFTVESTATGLYVNIPLTYPLSVKGLAGLFGVPADEVWSELADLAVEVSDG